MSDEEEEEDVDMGEEDESRLLDDDGADVSFLRGMGYERPTVSLVRMSAAMNEMRQRKQAELEEERLADLGMRQPGPADNVRQLLKHHFGSITHGWREAMDRRSVHKVGEQDFYKVLQDNGFGGNKKAAWKELAGERENITLADLDPRAAKLLSSFYSAYTEEMGPLNQMMTESDSLRISQAQFYHHCKLLSMRAPRGMKRKHPLNLKAIFSIFSTGHGYITENDCRWLEDYCNRGSSSHPSSPSKGKGPLEKIGWRNYIEVTRAKQQKQALIDFRALLHHKFGSIGKAWRKYFDLDAKGELGQEEFLKLAEGLKFQEAEKVWDECAGEDGEAIKLEHLEPRAELALQNYKDKCVECYGSLATAFQHATPDPKPLLSKQEFLKHCHEIRLEANPRLVFEYVDRQGSGKVLLSEIDAPAACAAFGQKACDDALEEFQKLEPQPKIKRVGISEHFKTQSMTTRRSPEQIPSERQALLRELERRFGSPLRGWSAVLDLQGKGKLKKDEFFVGCSAAGFKGCQSKLWEELKLKATGSVRLKDIAPEALEECKVFKACCGAQLGRMITAMEAAVPAREKKKGVRVTSEEFAELCKKVGYKGDSDRLISHLDVRGDGFLNSKVLRFFHEEKREEKAVTALAAKHKKDQQTRWRDKLASMKIAPTAEVKAVQDQMLLDARELRATKKETEKGKEEVYRAIRGKYHSIAMCWRLALNPDNLGGLTPEAWIEGLMRAGVMREDAEEAEMEKYANLFDEFVTEGKLLRYEHLDKTVGEAIEEVKERCDMYYGGTVDGLLQAFDDYDPDGTGEISVMDFKHLMHSIQATHVQTRLLHYLDAHKTGKIRLDWIDKDTAKEAKALADERRLKEEGEQPPPPGEDDDEEPPQRMSETQLRVEKRKAAAGQRALEAFKKELCNRHGTLVKAWREELSAEGAQRLSQDEFEEVFQEQGYSGDAETVWKALNPKGDKLTLEVLDPSLANDLAVLKKGLVERFGSVANAFEKVDLDGSFKLDMTRFLELCYECKYRGNERRLFAFLDRKDEKVISMMAIDRRAVREVKKRREEEERRRHPPPPSDEEEESESGEELEKSDMGSPKSKASSRRKSQDGGKPFRSMVAVEVARTVASAFRDHLDRIFGSSHALKAWRALDPEHRNALNKKEFFAGVRRVGFSGSPTVLWNLLMSDDSDQRLITMREVNPDAFGHLVSLRRRCHVRLQGLESLFEEKGELTRRLTEQDFCKLCRKIRCKKPYDRLFQMLDVKQTGTLVWEDVRWLEEHWDWEGINPEPLRQEARTRPLNQGLMARTIGSGPLCTYLRPSKVTLGKSNSLPSLAQKPRAQWNDRHHVLEHLGNKDMNIIHEVTAINTQESYYLQQRVLQRLMEVPTTQWLQENMPDTDDESDDDHDNDYDDND